MCWFFPPCFLFLRFNKNTPVNIEQKFASSFFAVIFAATNRNIISLPALPESSIFDTACSAKIMQGFIRAAFALLFSGRCTSGPGRGREKGAGRAISSQQGRGLSQWPDSPSATTLRAERRGGVEGGSKCGGPRPRRISAGSTFFRLLFTPICAEEMMAARNCWCLPSHLYHC